jgi:hypothetical protein
MIPSFALPSAAFIEKLFVFSVRGVTNARNAARLAAHDNARYSSARVIQNFLLNVVDEVSTVFLCRT